MKTTQEIVDKAENMSLGAETEHGFAVEDIESGLALALSALQASGGAEAKLREAFALVSSGDVDGARECVEAACRADRATLALLYPVLQRM